jgi:hypothetical protein
MALSAQTKSKRVLAPHPLERAARERIAEKLKEAAQLAKRDLGAGSTRIRDLLEEVLTQTEAFLLARDAEGRVDRNETSHRCEPEDDDRPTDADGAAARDANEPAQPHARLAFTALSKGCGEPVSEFLLIPFGQVQVERPIAGGSFEFTRGHADSAVRWFESIGRKLAIDYEHQTFDALNMRPDGLRPAAGWIGGLEARDDGLWATEVTWTEPAAALLRSGEYRYFSPVIYWTDENFSDVAALGPVALTNDPAMYGVPALAAGRMDQSRDREGAATSDAQRTARRAVAHKARRDGDKAAESEDPNDDTDCRSTSGAVEALRVELKAAQREVEILKRQLRTQEADAFVERGMRFGKILDSTSLDWRDDYLRDRALAEMRLSRAPVILPPGRVMKLDAQGRVAASRSLDAAVVGSGLSDVFEPDDLAAYRGALAAGRVRSAR